MPEVKTTREVADILGTSPRTVRRWALNGTFGLKPNVSATKKSTGLMFTVPMITRTLKRYAKTFS